MAGIDKLPALALLLAALSAVRAEAAETSRLRWTLGAELASLDASTRLVAAVHGGLGKLRYDETARRTDLTRAYATLDADIASSWSATLVAAYDDDGDGLGATEAYLEWRPIPRSRTRQQLKIGAFYPPLSLENTGPGWSSPFTTTFSAVNSWIAEELRSIGAEWSLERRLGYAGSGRAVRVHAAVVTGNDPTGTLLAWKGWSLHDRQSRLGDALALAALPQIQPGGLFERQAPRDEPFVETDERLGYYVGASWRLRHRVLVALTHYDNRADPLSLERGQYGWHTVFDHVGLQAELPARLGLIAQWLRGETAMGPVVGNAHVVDAAADAKFVMLTKDLERHRVSLRYDRFEVRDRDTTPLDSNAETGHAWTLAYRYRAMQRLVLSAEWLEVDSSRPARAYLGEPVFETERLLRLGAFLALGNAR